MSKILGIILLLHIFIDYLRLKERRKEIKSYFWGFVTGMILVFFIFNLAVHYEKSHPAKPLNDKEFKIIQQLTNEEVEK